MSSFWQLDDVLLSAVQCSHLIDLKYLNSRTLPCQRTDEMHQISDKPPPKIYNTRTVSVYVHTHFYAFHASEDKRALSFA